MTRFILLVSMMFIAPYSISCSSNGGERNETAPYTALGANFNENVTEPVTVIGELNSSGVEWVRGFVNIPHYFLDKDNDNKISGVKEAAFQSYTATKDFIKVRELSGNRIKLIMSLKIPFDGYSHLVPEEGTPQMEYLLEACRRFLILHDLGENIDILVMGNEPEWENGGDSEDYKTFLNIFAGKLVGWKAQYGWKFKVYAGALNRVSELNNSATIPVVVSVVNDNPNVAGIDLHVHALNIEQCDNDIRDIREKFNVTKDIICTEFSMVRALDLYVDQEIGQWGTDNGYSSAMKTYQWLNHVADMAAAGTPVSDEEFLSFFESRNNYPSKWYGTFYEEFSKYGLSCITGRFSCKSDGTRYNAASRMWDLGSIFSSKLMGVNPANGYMNPSPLVYPEFRKISEEITEGKK